LNNFDTNILLIDYPALALLRQDDCNINYVVPQSYNIDTQNYVNNLTEIKAHTHPVIQDSGATGHYWPTSMLPLLQDVQPNSSVAITLPDRSRLRSSHVGYFPHPVLPRPACRVQLFPRLAHALFSVSTFCEYGAIATFTKDQLYITLNGETVFNGYPKGRLWYTNLSHPDPPDTTVLRPNLSVCTQENNVHQPNISVLPPEISVHLQKLPHHQQNPTSPHPTKFQVEHNNILVPTPKTCVQTQNVPKTSPSSTRPTPPTLQ
jgi:hypothetical protein